MIAVQSFDDSIRYFALFCICILDRDSDSLEWTFTLEYLNHCHVGSTLPKQDDINFGVDLGVGGGCWCVFPETGLVESLGFSSAFAGYLIIRNSQLAHRLGLSWKFDA